MAMVKEEILNIEYHVKRMVVKALNKFETLPPAAQALGIDLRTLHNYKKRFGIDYCTSCKRYHSNENHPLCNLVTRN